MATEWVTYTRPPRSRHHAEGATITRESNRPRPTGFTLDPRPATENEIRDELERRSALDEKKRITEEFCARPDYVDATAIRAALEFMDPGNHPLDRLTPEEWAEVRRKLTQETA